MATHETRNLARTTRRRNQLEIQLAECRRQLAARGVELAGLRGTVSEFQRIALEQPMNDTLRAALADLIDAAHRRGPDL